MRASLFRIISAYSISSHSHTYTLLIRTLRDNPLWTESALKYYEEQELSMQVNPTDVVGQMLAAASAANAKNQVQQQQQQQQQQQPAPEQLLSQHYSALLLEANRTKMRQRVPDTDAVS